MSDEQYPKALIPGTLIGRVDDFPDGECQEWVMDTEAAQEPIRLIIFRQGKMASGFINRCPHFQLPLSNDGHFMMWDEETIMCIHHSAVFRLTDGYCTDGPCLGAALDSIPLEVVGEEILVK